MKRKRLILAAAAIVLLALILLIGFCLGRRSAVSPSDITLNRSVRRLEFYVCGNPEPSLLNLEVGMTLPELEKLLPGVEKLPWVDNRKTIYFWENQIALICVAYDNETVDGYAVFSSDRTPLKVDLSSGQSYYSQMVSADLAKADFKNQTLYEIMDQYGFDYNNRSSFQHIQPVLLDDGRLLTMFGPTFGQSESYRAFYNDHSAPGDYLWYMDAHDRSITGDTYLTKVTFWDIFRFKPGMSWGDIQVETILEEPRETVIQRNSDYFLRWIREHVPEGMTLEEVDRWIEDFRANSTQPATEASP